MLSACAGPLPAPEATGTAFDPGDAPSRGPTSAPVQLVEFADFRCGYCARFQPALDGLLEEYPEQVRLAFVHMPVVSRDSGPAAVAAEAARRQGAFWGMHDALFALQGAPLREADVRMAALELGLDVERFAADLRDPLLLERVRADLAHVRRIGIDGTPALLVNGRLYVGLLSSDELQRLVEAALAAAR